MAASPPALAHLQDGFSRTDDANLGAGWIEKNPVAFTLVDGQAVKVPVGTGYRDNVVYRPAGEDVRDVEASVEMQFSTLPPGYPQVLVRVQSSTAATADVLDGYMLYIPDSSTQAILGRQNGSAFVSTLATMNFSAPLNVTDRFRLRLSAVGTNPVQLNAYVERRGAGGAWTVIGQTSALDSSAQRIATAGSVGFSGYVENAYRYDNFMRVDLGAVGTTNPAPTVSSLAPASASAGENGLLVVVYGTGFTTDSVVRWNGSNRATTYFSPSELEATITAADLASAGTANVSVSNPAPGGGASANLAFTISSPNTPTITSVSPTETMAGSPALTLTVNGSGFNAGSVVRWNGTNRSTTFVSTTQLTAAITTSDLANASSNAVTVFRSSDNTTSASATFTVLAPASANFTDTFDRADNANIGAGWIEKAPSAFSIVAESAAKVGVGASDYRNNIVYRPAVENLADVEASVELRVQSLPVGYPQVMVRIQTNTVTTLNALDAYMLYLPDSTTQAVLARQRGGAYDTTLLTIGLNAALNTTDTYRLRLRATGVNPVQLQAFVERFVSGSWQILGQGAFNDGNADRISGAGSVGFGGYIETNYRYDNFRRIDLTQTAPVPSVTSLTPSSVAAGSPAFDLTVNGANFTANSVVRWNGVERTTTYVSATELQAAISSADLASAGSANVTVFTPAPGGGVSSALTFNITSQTGSNPVPTLTSLAPSSANAGGSAFTLTVNGSNFAPGAVVRWNGSDRSTSYVSASQLTAAIAAGDIAAQGSANVSVFNPAPGGGLSGALAFAINPPANNPTPTLASLSPSSAAAGSPAFTLTVNGTNYVAGSVVRWNGVNRPTTYISAGQLTAAISATDIAAQGTASVTVFNPTPGGGLSTARTFTIGAPSSNAPTPVLTSMSPTTWPTGGGAFTLNVLGSGFTSQSVVHWNGAPRSTTIVSANQLQASINSADVSAGGVPSVTVVTPAPGGGRSSPLTFFVQSGSIEYFADSFNRADAANVGSGWIEKSPNTFSIQNGELTSIGPTEGFQQDIMYRPASESRLDMEASIEFRRLPSGADLYTANWPQVHARVQTDNVTFPYTLDSYIFFIEELAAAPRAMFAITASPTVGSRNECYISQLPLPSALVTGERYRLRLRVSGTSPVTLWGAVDRFVDGAWTALASGSTTHSINTVRDPSLYCDEATLPPPIVNPGVAGTAKWVNRTDAYDNFYVRDLAALDPPPAISTLSPTSASAGAAGFTLTVNGSNFTPDSSVRWNGAVRATQFISSTQLRATISAEDLALAGLASVTVVTPSGTSGQLPFSIQPVAGVVSFQDAFSRADSATLGQSWIEKTPAAFSLQGGTALKAATPSGDYRNNIVLRPAAEDRRDAEALVEFRVRAQPVGYPMVVTRVQQATAMTQNGFEGYLMFMDDSNTSVVLARQRLGEYETRLMTFNLNEPLALNGTYRMRLRAVGDASVNIQATVERLSSNGVWAVIGQASFVDSSGQRIAAPGASGFGGYIEAAYSFDNFRTVNLGTN